MFLLPPIFALLLLSLLVYNHIIYPAFISPLSKIPSAHFSAPFLDIWIRSKRRNGKTGISAIFAAHEVHGPIVRLSPNELSVASLDGLRQVYIGAFEKTNWYSIFANYKVPNLVSMLRNRPHSVHKRMISHVYSKSYIQSSTDLQTTSRVLLINRLLPIVRTAAEAGTPFDAYGLNQALGGDFMTSYLFGISNCSDLIRDQDARQELLAKFRTKARNLPGHERASQELEAYVLSLCEAGKSAQHLSGSGPTSKPVVYSSLSTHLSKSDTSLPYRTDYAAASEMLDHLLSGIETARITLTYLEWELSQRPELQTTLREELLTLAPHPTHGNESRVLSDPKALDALPLLDAIVKETIRLYPPSPALLPRITPPGGARIDGYAIPGGVTVGTSAYCMHRNETVFLSAGSFKPERWFDEKRGVEMNRWWWGFGSGGRMCLGSHFANYSEFQCFFW
jgi:hypothetical protein